ncbi:CPBP family intramembrane metalloprotease [Methylonatrum kenyense]|uniref:CPBP family intramembrane glutamic endopeptidase n=1 Tax=Methylonatrum kenyense TaxID=455253 RepID=UPI0020BD633B|nr:type II CAAX endopeptidase family protein [Methylonatrum kenyense]MCK8517059.1 CPBP family intramembrane metalloprotease [Methylonatrum kenyense]
MAESSRPTRLALTGELALAVALVLFAGITAAVIGSAFAGPATPLALQVVLAQGLIILAGLYSLLRWRAIPWSAIGLVRPQLRDLPRGLTVLLVVFLCNGVFAGLVMLLSPGALEQHHARLTDVAGFLVGGLPLAAIAALMLFVALYEELLARGFLLHRSRLLLAGIWPPVMLSSLLFGLGHGYQGWIGIAQTALVGIVLARATLHWNTLWPAIIAHAALNTVALGLLLGA